MYKDHDMYAYISEVIYTYANAVYGDNAANDSHLTKAPISISIN